MQNQNLTTGNGEINEQSFNNPHTKLAIWLSENTHSDHFIRIFILHHKCIEAWTKCLYFVDIVKCIFLDAKVCTLIQISLESTLVQVMTCHWTGGKLLLESKHYVGKALRRLSAWDPGCGGPSTPIRVGHPWAAARCAALVQRFSQWPVKKYFFSNRCKSQNKHQNWILQLETNKSSGRTTEFHRV